MIHSAQAPPVPSPSSAYKKGVQIPMARPGQPASQENALFSAIPVEVEFKSEGNGAQEHSQQSKRKSTTIGFWGRFVRTVRLFFITRLPSGNLRCSCTP